MSDIDKPNNSSTVQSAMNYVDTPAANISSWKVKDLGLQFLLFGVAEIQAKRVVRLLDRVYDLEDIVFSEDNLRELDPARILSAYKMGTEALKEATEYIAKTRKDMNWEVIGSTLNEMAITDTETPENVDLNKFANKLLEAMNNNKKEPNGSEL